MSRAREEWRDDVTGLPVPAGSPGATRSGELVARVRPRKDAPPVSVPVDREEVLPASVSWRVDPTFDQDLRARAKTRARARKATKAPRIAKTFKSAKQAAETFYGNNPFFAEAASADPFDVVRDWMDGIEVKIGKRWRRLHETPRGRKLLDLYRRTPDRGIRETLAWLFGRSRGRRWAAVDWSAIDSFVEALRDPWERARDRGAVGTGEWVSGGGLTWYPPGAGQTVSAAELEDLPPEAAEAAAARVNADRLGEDLDELESVYKGARRCLSDVERKIWRRRMRQLRALRTEPERIARLALCEPEGVSRICRYPVLWESIGQLRRACAVRAGDEPAELDEGLDLPWENPRKMTTTRVVVQNPSAPKLDDLGVVVELGRVAEIEIERDGRREVHRWRGAAQPLLLWSPRQRALVWVHGRKPSRARAGVPEGDRAASAFKTWSLRNARSHRRLAMPTARPAELGRAIRIVYRSDKWVRRGRLRAFEHEFGPGVRVWRYGSRSPCAFAVAGGKLTVTARGIVN